MWDQTTAESLWKVGRFQKRQISVFSSYKFRLSWGRGIRTENKINFAFAASCFTRLLPAERLRRSVLGSVVLSLLAECQEYVPDETLQDGR